jgi:cellulose synthase (UDP-forming)
MHTAPVNTAVPIMLIGFLILLMLLTTSGHKGRQPKRALVCAVTGLMAAIYIVWRVRATWSLEASDPGIVWIWVCTVVDVIGLLDFILFMLLMSRFVDRTKAAQLAEQRLRDRPADELPDVDVWIATYDEAWSILEKTIVGALDLDWPQHKLHIYVLDDGRRAWLEERCRNLGLSYITRPDNRDRKAGNHNNALRVTKSPFILTLDADFIPFRHAIRRMIGLLDDPTVAIVQSPQAYYNHAPFRSNLMLHDAIPDDLEFFYKAMQPSRDAWNAAFYCGTSAVLRRSALEAVGGFATESDIEDQITSLALLSHGYRTVFLAERLSVGLAPESSAALHDQRNRWCRGSLQILFTRYGPFGRGFTLIQRLLFLQSYWVLGAFLPLFYAMLPCSVWLFGARLFPHVNPTDLAVMPTVLLLAIWLSLAWVSDRTWTPIVTQSFQLFTAVEQLPTALASLIKPFGKPLIHIGPVTPKGALCKRRKVDRLTCRVLVGVMIVTVVSVAIAAYSRQGVLRDPLEVFTALGWTALDLMICGIAALICFELPYNRGEERFRVQEGGRIIDASATDIDMRVENLSLTGVQFATASPMSVSPGGTLVLALGTVSQLPCLVRRVDADRQRYSVSFNRLDDATRQALIKRLYLGLEMKANPTAMRIWPVIRLLLARFLRWDF